ncbi:MAG: hypothetical protein PHO96_04955 [Candidatus Izemoplasmatales bacterium]|nr:hypothetical protein [Candidatus Izemoplasmatales bacterium]
MLDLKLIREEPERIIELLNRRGGDHSYIYEVIEKDQRRRDAISSVESLKAKKNAVSRLVGQYKREMRCCPDSRGNERLFSTDLRFG